MLFSICFSHMVKNGPVLTILYFLPLSVFVYVYIGRKLLQTKWGKVNIIKYCPTYSTIFPEMLKYWLDM